jgi:hypothetical protein
MQSKQLHLILIVHSELIVNKLSQKSDYIHPICSVYTMFRCENDATNLHYYAMMMIYSVIVGMMDVLM